MGNYKSADGQLQNNSINDPMLITFNPVIRKIRVDDDIFMGLGAVVKMAFSLDYLYQVLPYSYYLKIM